MVHTVDGAAAPPRKYPKQHALGRLGRSCNRADLPPPPATPTAWGEWQVSDERNVIDTPNGPAFHAKCGREAVFLFHKDQLYNIVWNKERTMCDWRWDDYSTAQNCTRLRFCFRLRDIHATFPEGHIHKF